MKTLHISTSSRRFAVTIVAALLIAPLGCKKQDGIQAYSAPKDPPTVAVSDTADAPDPSAQPPAPAEEQDAVMRWTPPEGWTPVSVENNGKGFAPDAIYQAAPEDPKVLAKVSHLGDAPLARSVLENVKRWQRELKTPEATEENLAKYVTPLRLGDLPIDMVHLGNGTDELIAAIIPYGHTTWFIRLSGPMETVQAHKQQFAMFMASLRFESPTASGPEPATPATTDGAPPAPPSADVASGVAGATWTLPPGWTAARGDSFRLATIRPGNGSAEIKVSKFGGLGGGAGSNVSRWHNDVGLDPVDDAHADPGQQVTFGNQTWTVHDYTGPKNGGMRVIIAQTEANGIWFFKMLGPTNDIGAAKPMFDQFLGSIRFGP